MRILNVGQVCDLEKGGIANQMSVQLKDGRVVIITTDESTVAQLIDAAAAELKGTPINTVSVATAEEPLPPPAPEPLEGTEFGGDVPDPGETSDAPVPPPTGTLDVTASPEPEFPRDKLGRPIKRGPDRRSALGAGHPNKKGRVDPYRTVESVPAKTVPYDEAGNPIVAQTKTPPQAPPAEDEDGTSI